VERFRLSLLLILALLAAVPAYAGDERLDSSVFIGRYLRDEDVTALFDYLRQSVRATAEGREPPKPPEELARRLEESGRLLHDDSVNLALGMLDAMEREIRDMLREERSRHPMFP
jgi:hypothetical protein